MTCDNHPTLEHRTLAFWKLSMQWNGKLPANTVERTFKDIRELKATTDPYKPLAFRIRQLSHDIVEGGQRKKLRGKTANILVCDEASSFKGQDK